MKVLITWYRNGKVIAKQSCSNMKYAEHYVKKYSKGLKCLGVITKS